MNLVDQLICEIDTGLRTVFAHPQPDRKMPSAGNDTSEPLSPADRVESARLMRVNHTGEVCAQALYQGQALVARTAKTRELLIEAAREERDHLAWCAERIEALGGHTSLLNPLFYSGAFGLGVMSGLLGDKWSMGFLVETERQVEAHLDDHLSRLPENDATSKQVLETMRADEIRHGQSGVAHGALPVPAPIKAAMRQFSKVMTHTTYRI